MNSSFQLVILDMSALAAAFASGRLARGDIRVRNVPPALETAVFLLYTAVPPIGMALALLAMVMAVREAIAGRCLWQACVATLFSVGILALVPRLFAFFTP